MEELLGDQLISRLNQVFQDNGIQHGIMTPDLLVQTLNRMGLSEAIERILHWGARPVAPRPEDREPAAPAPAMLRTRTQAQLHVWRERLHSMPEGFALPVGLPVNAFIAWVHGNEASGYPPLRLVPPCDVSRAGDAPQRFGDYLYLMKQFEAVIEHKLKPPARWQDSVSLSEMKTLYEQAVHPVVMKIFSQPTPKARQRRSSELSWTTLVKLWRIFAKNKTVEHLVAV